MKRVLLAGLVLTACSSTSPAPTPSHTPVPVQGILPTSSTVPMPDHQLTPGVVGTTDVHKICPHTDPAVQAARPGTSVKLRVYAEYHVLHRLPGQYEIDHLIPLELGGSNDIRNLWPEPNDHPPGHLNTKDILENKLHSLVCAGQVPLPIAQKAIADDWHEAYALYVLHTGG